MALNWLGNMKWNDLEKDSQLALLRAYALVFSRLGAPGEEERKKSIQAVDGAYPANDDELNAELCRFLCYLQAPKVVDRTLDLMASPKNTTWPDWAELAARNSGYGRAVLSMLRNFRRLLATFTTRLCVRNVKGPWTEGPRRQIMEWFASVRSKSGGNSYKKFIAKIEKDMLDNAAAEEREMIAGWDLPQAPNIFEGLPTSQGTRSHLHRCRCGEDRRRSLQGRSQERQEYVQGHSLLCLSPSERRRGISRTGSYCGGRTFLLGRYR